MGKCAGYGLRFGGDDRTISFVSNDHLFESTSARDTYFTNNLNELVTSTPIVVNDGTQVLFQVWSGTTNPSSYDSSLWTDMAIPVRFVDLVDTPSSLTGNRLIQVNAAGNALIHTEARFIGNDLFIPGTLRTESGTVALGDVVDLSESGGFLSLVNNLDNRRYNVLDYHVPADAASSRPRRLRLSAAESRVVLNSGTGTSIQGREITATYTASGTGRINALIIATFAGYSNLRIRISNVSPGDAQPIKYIPSRQAWLDGTGGLTVTEIGEQTLRIDDSPLIYNNGRQYSITYRTSTGDLNGDSAGPFLAVMAQTGSFLDIADYADLGNYRFDNTVQISSDVTITSSNLSNYDRKLWIVNSGPGVTVSLSDNLNLNYFGFVVIAGTLDIAQVTSGSARIDGATSREFESGDGVIYIRALANNYRRLTQRGEQGNPGRTGIPGPEGPAGPAGSTSFIGLTDTPSSFGTAGQIAVINDDADGLEFADLSSTGASTFLALTDTPSTYTAFRYLRTNSDGTAVELVTLPASIFNVQNNGTVVSNTVSTLNFTDNLTATSAGSGQVNIAGSAGSSSTTFLALTDTPSSFTANQFVRVNAAGNGLEFGGTLGDASTNWDHATLPSGRIPANNRRWYTYTGTSNASRDLPLESGISSGWHCFLGNDSTTGTLTLVGDFRGSVTRIALLPQQGCELSYNGSIFLEGPARQLITVSNFPDWQGNPLRHDTSYTGFSTNSAGLNLNNIATREALLNRNVRISTRTDNNFLFDLEPIRTKHTQHLSLIHI